MNNTACLPLPESAEVRDDFDWAEKGRRPHTGLAGLSPENDILIHDSQSNIFSIFFSSQDPWNMHVYKGYRAGLLALSYSSEGSYALCSVIITTK